MSKEPSSRGRPRGRTPAVKAQARRARQLYRDGMRVVEIAHELGVSRQWVSRLLGTLRQPRRRGPPWSAAEDALLGTLPDQEVAARLGRPVKTVQARRTRLAIPSWRAERTARRDALLGTLTDQEIAARCGMRSSTIRARRCQLGIPNHAGKQVPPRRPWSAADDALLGTLPDTEVAARLGRSRLQVFYRRQRLGVPSYRPPV